MSVAFGELCNHVDYSGLRDMILSPVMYSGFSTLEKCGEHRVNKSLVFFVFA